MSAFRQSKLPEPRPHTRVEDEGAVERKYAFGSVLGQGSFGLVKEVTCQTSGECFAVKIVNKDKVCEECLCKGEGWRLQRCARNSLACNSPSHSLQDGSALLDCCSDVNEVTHVQHNAGW